MILKAWITSSILCYSLDFSKPVASINLINLWTRAYIVCLYDCLNDDYPAAAAAEPLQSCPTLCDPIVGSLLGSAIPGILQARTLEWVAIAFSNAGKWKVKVKSLSRAWLLASPWTAALQAPLSMGYSRQEYWSGVPLPSPRFLCSHGWMPSSCVIVLLGWGEIFFVSVTSCRKWLFPFMISY